MYLIAFAALALAIPGAPVCAVDSDLGAFDIPLLQEDAAAARKVRDPSAARIETVPGSKLEVVKAASTQDAINHALSGILGALKSLRPSAQDASSQDGKANDPQRQDAPPQGGEPPREDPSQDEPPPHESDRDPPRTTQPPEQGSGGTLGDLTERPGGVQIIETGSGYGVVGVGSAWYDTNRSNSNLVLEDQRRAWMEADLAARAQVARFLNQVDVKGKQEIQSRLHLANTDEFSGANLDATSTEDYSAVVSAMVTGLVTYDVLDDPETGEVRVSVVSTPKTRGETRNAGSRTVLASSIEAGMAQIMNQLALNVVPPVGAKLVTVPQTGETVYVGFGADVIQSHENKRIQGEIRAAAQKAAELRATSALVALLRGQRIETESSFSSRFDEMITEFDRITDESGEIVIKEARIGRASVVSEKVNESTTASVVDGKAPAGTMIKVFERPGSRWVYVLAVYAESIPALLRSGPPVAAPNAPNPPPADRTPPPPAQDRPTTVAPNPGDPCPPGSVEEGVIRRVSVGTGRNKAEAIQNALLYAVKQVNENRVSGDIRMKKKFADAIEDVDGKLRQSLAVDTEIDENVESISNGLVRGYRVLYEGGLRPLVTPNSQGDVYEVDLCVDIPQFDPNKPRPGQRSTIAFLGLRTGRTQFEIGGEVVPAQESANEFENEVVTYLTSEKRFTVIDRAYMSQWRGEIDLVKEAVASRDMSMDELRNVGHMLSADYVLVGTLQEVSFKQWDEYIAIRKRNEPRALLNINVHLRMIRTATGEIVFSDGFNRTWMLPEIGELLSRYGNMDRALLAAKEAAMTLLPRVLGEVAKESAAQAKIRVIKVGLGEFVLANDDRSVREGDELVVYVTENIDFEGKSYASETAVARLGVIKVQGPVVTAKLLQGDAAAVKVGATCRREDG